MSTFALYDVLHGFKDVHQVVFQLAEDLNDVYKLALVRQQSRENNILECRSVT